MDTEQSAYVSAQQKHHRYMIFGKKQRYIEVFQCSGEDMNLVLTGGLPAPTSPAKPQPSTSALLTTGGAMMSKPPTGFTPIPFATASLPSGQFLQTPIFYWPLYPSPPVSPTGYYMGPPPIGPLGQLHQAQQQRHPLTPITPSTLSDCH
ncbi:hypothetical protein HUJ05_007014 [Dendroctonus ponderosae]|nr:hypothetical protein HUJ05_007014 [Dendroctonus ponderosae]